MDAKLADATRWARAHVPDEDPSLAGMAAFMLERLEGKVPTPDAVRARLKTQGRSMEQLRPYLREES